MKTNEQKLPSIITLDAAIEALTNHSFYIHVDQEQIIDWLKELREYKQADGSLQNDSNVLHDMIKTEFIKYILLLDNASIQKVMREIDDDDILKATKSIFRTKEVWKRFFQNMTKRKQKIMDEEYEYMGPIRSTDGLLSQRKILSIIYHLIDVGEITI